MNCIATLKTVNDDFEVEYEILSPIDISAITDPNRQEIAVALQDVDAQIRLCEDEIAKLSTEIEQLTNQADGLDYTVAVASGIIAGLIDSFFVGETEIDIEKIQATLEEKYHTANDDEYRHTDKDGKWTDSATYHRLDDLAHHPTVLGLVAAILVRYFRLVVFVDGQDGKPHIFFADKSVNEKTRKLEKDQLIKAWVGVIFSGLFMWLANIAENKCNEAYNGEMPEALRKIIKMLGSAPLVIEFLKTADVWIGHMMSDVSTSQGIPGVFLSLLKELSALPVIRDTKLPGLVDDLYNSGVMNLPEWGGVVFTAAKKQAMPVIINEVLVRGFYFVRRLITEYRTHQNFKEVNWSAVIPLGNRTVERMITIASGTFTAADIADAAIRSGGFNAACLLRVNFVGVGRFAVAIGTDVAMGVKRGKLQKEKFIAIGRQLDLLDVKVSYLYTSAEYEIRDSLEEQSKLWITAEDTVSTLMEASECTIQAVEFCKESLQEISESRRKISDYLDAIEQKNPGIKKETLDTIRWGDLSWKHN